MNAMLHLVRLENSNWDQKKTCQKLQFFSMDFWSCPLVFTLSLLLRFGNYIQLYSCSLWWKERKRTNSCINNLIFCIHHLMTIHLFKRHDLLYDLKCRSAWWFSNICCFTAYDECALPCFLRCCVLLNFHDNTWRTHANKQCAKTIICSSLLKEVFHFAVFASIYSIRVFKSISQLHQCHIN